MRHLVGDGWLVPAPGSSIRVCAGPHTRSRAASSSKWRCHSFVACRATSNPMARRYPGSNFRTVVLVALACLIAVGCDGGDPAMAPMCMEKMGCPAGTVCVDGARCEPIPDATIPMSAPRPSLGGSAPRPGGSTGRPGQGSTQDGGIACGGLTLCRGECVDTTIDPTNCGACGITCPAGQGCSQGICCGDNLTVCGNRCVDLLTDPTNCGVCGFPCILGLSCVLGQCTPAQPTPLPF